MSMLFFGLGGTVVTETFTSNTTWVAPTSTNKIMRIEGKGRNGVAPAYSLTHTFSIYAVTYTTSSLGGTAGFKTWADMKAYLDLAISYVNVGGTSGASYTDAVLKQYYASSYDLTTGSYPLPAHDRAANTGSITYYGGAAASGSITSSGYATVSYNYLDSGDYGPYSTAFSLTFFGGSPSVPTAPITVFTNVTVTPSTSYSIVVPSGGYIIITYAK